MGYKYSNVSKQMTLMVAVNVSDTVLVVDDATGLPITFPYRLAIGLNTSGIEIVYCTASTGNNLTVQRGREDTAAQSHSVGSKVDHVWSAGDGQDVAAHMDGIQNVHGIGVPSSVVGTQTAQTLTNKSIDGSQNTLTNIPSSAISNSPNFHAILADNVGVSSSSPITTDVVAGSIVPSLNVKYSDDVTQAGVVIFPDAASATGDFLLCNDVPTSDRFRVKRNGDVTVSRALTVGDKSTMKDAVMEQRANAAIALEVTAGSGAPAPTVSLVRFLAHDSKPALDLKRNSNTNGSQPIFRVLSETDLELLRINRDGSFGSIVVAGIVGTGNWSTAGTITGSDHIISAGSRSIKGELDALNNAWNTSWTPTLTNLTLGNGTLTSRYRQTGKTVDWYFRFVLGSTSAVGSVPQFTAPVTPAGHYPAGVGFTLFPGWVHLVDSGTTANQGGIFWSGTAFVIVRWINAASFSDMSSTVPWTWTTGDSITAQGSYEAA